jgi:hypothetical protein
MWHKWFDGAWSDWEDLGGELASAPAVAARGPNRLDCFVQGTDNQLWRKSFTGSVWTEWEALGGIITEAPAAVARGLKRIDCLVRGAENNLWQKSWGRIRFRSTIVRTWAALSTVAVCLILNRKQDPMTRLPHLLVLQWLEGSRRVLCDACRSYRH